jgi:tetratricopeptide (TPR) repeat protein
MKRPAPQIAIAIAALILITAAVTAATAAPAHALPKKEPWIELRTANFTLFSNAPEKTVRRVGVDLERLRDALSQLVPGLALNSPSPTYIFVFKNAESFLPYQRVNDGRTLQSGGYFLARQLANYVAIYVYANYTDQHRDERLVIYHEYIHNVLRNNYASLPLWFHEGLAEYYSTFEVGKDTALIGLPIKEHVTWLRQNPMPPLASLFAVDEHSRDYNEATRRGGFYAQSWALVHYLISGSPERRLQATESLRLAQAGTPPDQIFRRAFGADSVALERELSKYVKSYLFPTTSATTRVPLRTEANLAMKVVPMAWVDVLFRLGDLLANISSEQSAVATEHFQAILAEQPDYGPAMAGLGHLEELAGRAEAARPWYEKAAQLAPEDFFVQYRYGLNQIEEPGPDSLQKARAALKKAVLLRPDIGEAWARLGYTYQAADELPPEAIEAMETAHRLLPSRMDVAHNLAIAYARTGQRAKAEALIENVLVPRAEPEMIANAREALVDEDYARAETLVNEGHLDEALPLLEQLRDRTSLSSRKVEITARITEIREAQSYNRFVDGYNQAVDLVNQGDVRGALAILEPLIETTQDPTQVERARTLVQRLKGPEKKRSGPKPR